MRIAGYRLIRSVIREITQGLDEGVKNLYGWSALVDGKFKQSMDTIKTAMGYMKNSFAAAVSPIINALAPAIDFLIDKIVALINLINQLFARLSGASSWTRAKKNVEEYGDAVGGAGGAAKEALKYLAPFDELNRLPDENKGGGGGGSAEDFSDMFEEMVDFNENLADFADNVRTAIENGNWSGLGVYLGAKVNQLIDEIDFAGAGAKVGGFINAWFTTQYWTLETINFQNIGSKIAEFLNNALYNINFETIGRTLAVKFTILPDLIIGFIEEADWSAIGDSIGSFIRGAFDEWTSWLNGINWEQFGSDLVKSIGDAISGLDPAATASSIATFIETALKAALKLLKGVAKALFTGGTITASADMDASINVTGFSISDATNSSNADWHRALLGGLGVASAAIGLKLGGIKGAVFGATIGMGISAGIQAFEFFESWAGGSPDASKLGEAIVNALPAIGAIIGLAVGGPGGAFLGATIGVGLSFLIQTVEWEWDTDIEGPTGNSGGGSFLGAPIGDIKEGIDIPATATVKDVKIDLPDDGHGNRFLDGLDVGANVTSVDTSKVDNTEINTKSKFTSFIKDYTSGQLTSGGSPIIGAQSKFTTFTKGYTKGDRTSGGSPIIGAQSKFTTFVKNYTKGGNESENVSESSRHTTRQKSRVLSLARWRSLSAKTQVRYKIVLVKLLWMCGQRLSVRRIRQRSPRIYGQLAQAERLVAHTTAAVGTESLSTQAAAAPTGAFSSLARLGRRSWAMSVGAPKSSTSPSLPQRCTPLCVVRWRVRESEWWAAPR